MNLTIDDFKEGKWVEYMDDFMYADLSIDSAFINTNAHYYVLTIYKQGREYGIRRVYYKSGKLADLVYFRDGRKNGTEKEYYENGKLKHEWSFINNFLNGIDKWYDANGNEIKR
jgi:hypothetical protein